MQVSVEVTCRLLSTVSSSLHLVVRLCYRQNAPEIARLVAVVVRLVGALNGEAKVLALLLRKHSELDAELLEVGTGDLLIQLLA